MFITLPSPLVILFSPYHNYLCPSVSLLLTTYFPRGLVWLQTQAMRPMIIRLLLFIQTMHLTIYPKHSVRAARRLNCSNTQHTRKSEDLGRTGSRNGHGSSILKRATLRCYVCIHFSMGIVRSVWCTIGFNNKRKGVKKFPGTGFRGCTSTRSLPGCSGNWTKLGMSRLY